MEQQQQEPSVEQQAAEGKLGLFTPDEGTGDAKGAPDGVQKEGQEEKEQEEGQGQRLSSALEEIARRDREVFEKSQALKERETELSKYKKLEEQARENPDEILRAFGIDPVDYIYQNISSDKKAEAKPTVDPEKEQLRQRLEQLEQARSQDQNAHLYQAELGKIQAAAKSLGDDLPLVSRGMAAGPEMAQQILEAAVIEYQKSKVQPSYPDLVKRAEQLLEQQLLTAFEQVSTIDKYKSRMNEILGGQVQAPSKRPEEPQLASKTLSRDMGGDKAAPESRAQTFEEREAEFVRLIREKGWVEEEE